MKKKIEIILAAATLMFLCFSIGYFTGRRSVPTSVTVSGSGTVLINPEETPSDNSASAYFEATPSPSAPVTASSAPSAAPTASSAPPPSPSASESASPAVSSDGTATNDAHYDEQGRLRINLATQEELESLPGIGPSLAQRIIEFREVNGSINRITTLKTISGIGEKRYAAIEALITAD